MKHKTCNIKQEESGMLHAPCSMLRDRQGFTLMEVVVSVSIFAGTITVMLSLFNTTLQIYRKVEAQRQVAQSVRTSMEFLVKEIRNGQVDYNVRDGLTITTPVSGCDTKQPAVLGDNSYLQTEDRIQLINVDGERECVYLSGTNLLVRKDGQTTASQLNPPNVALNMFKLYIRPRRDPYTDSTGGFGTPLVETQPAVTILAIASVTLPTGEVRTIPYQTSVTTYLYDIPSQ